MTAQDECSLCVADLDGAPERDRAVVTEHWRLTAHRSALEGWMLLVPRRHIEALHELTNAEAAELGPLLQRVSRLQTDVFDALKTYVMQFAEGVSHAHFSLVPRRPDLPAERKGAKVSAYNSQDEPVSEDRRDELARQIRRAWDTL